MLTKAAKLIITAGMVAVAAVALGSMHPLGLLSVDWEDSRTVPFKVSNKLEIAADSYLLKQSSLSLLCGPSGSHLMLRTRLPRPRVIDGELWPVSKVPNNSTSVSFDWRKVQGGVTIPSIKTRFAVISSDAVDTLVTEFLSQKDQAVLAGWFRRGAPQGMRFALGEFGSSRLNSISSPKAVDHFFRRCGLRG